MATWPPTLDDVKLDKGIDADDTRDDAKLSQTLDSAVSFVERIHRGRVNFAGDLGSPLPDATPDLVLGTIRLALRWHERRNSPDALVEMADMGSGRIPSFDPDIDRLLRIGRHVRPVVG